MSGLPYAGFFKCTGEKDEQFIVLSACGRGIKYQFNGGIGACLTTGERRQARREEGEEAKSVSRL